MKEYTNKWVREIYWSINKIPSVYNIFSGDYSTINYYGMRDQLVGEYLAYGKVISK